MNKWIRFLVTGVVIALVAMALPMTAKQVVAQGSGGVIIEGTFGSGPNQFNPLLCNDTACRRIVGLMFPGMLAVNPQKAVVEAGAAGGLAKEIILSPDNKVVTLKLRNDWKWSDGTPITSKDIAYAWQVYNDKDSGSPFTFLTGLIEKVETPDDYTVVITMVNADCNAVNNASFYFGPAHVFKDTAIKDLKNSPYNTNPTVTAGVFKFQEYRTGERTSIVRDETYPDALEGGVKPDGLIYNVVPDQTVLVERFLAGEFNVIDGPPVNRRADIKAAGEKGDAKVFDFPGNSWDYFAMNLADPANPQNGLDKDNKVIDQGKHPLFGDLQVRKAIAAAIDVDAIIKGAVFGEGARMSSFLIPTSWAADANLKPLAYDPEAAKKMLDEAGWKAGADGIREKDGVKAKFTLITNQGNTRREAVATIIKDSLVQVGIEVDVQTIDFNVLLSRMDAQTFDALILGWRNGFPDDPDPTQLFTVTSDVVGSGNNFTSYNNPKFDELAKKALSVPGCKFEDRAKVYQEMEKMFQEDLPYVPLFVINGQYAARKNVNGFDPLPNQMYWNVDAWSVVTQ